MDCFDLLVLRSRDTVLHKQYFFCSCGVCWFSKYVPLTYLGSAVYGYNFCKNIKLLKDYNYSRDRVTPERISHTRGSCILSNAELLFLEKAVWNCSKSSLMLNTRLTCSGNYSEQRGTLIYASKGVHHSWVAFTVFNLHLSLY